MNTHSIITRCRLLLAKKSRTAVFHKPIVTVSLALLFAGSFMAGPSAPGQTVLFDIDNAPIHTSLPISLTASGITAYFSATGQGFSVQDYFGNNFVPAGFSGLFLSPNSINASDLLVRFDQALTDFSIMYAPEEYGCDTSATMRVTAYMSGSYVGTTTKVASNPGTWPVDTLKCIFPEGFDSVVVHYDSHPSTGCTDWGPIFAADNMRVTPLNPNAVAEDERPGSFALYQNYPNPFNQTTVIGYRLPAYSDVRLVIIDLLGREIATLVNGVGQPGYTSVTFSGDGLASGIYQYRLRAGGIVQMKRCIILK
jgi:hypothetical protein